ncbi:MAG: hypothetical protein K2G93_03590, partial [Rikenella sp.]|nr:hypothetical protein [Rikenella sp.]
MKRFFVAVALTGTVVGAWAGPKRYIAPYVIAQGQELPRSEFVSYRSLRDAFRDDVDSSQYYIGLNGAWSWRFFASEAEVPTDVLGG